MCCHVLRLIRRQHVNFQAISFLFSKWKIKERNGLPIIFSSFYYWPFSFLRSIERRMWANESFLSLTWRIDLADLNKRKKKSNRSVFFCFSYDRSKWLLFLFFFYGSARSYRQELEREWSYVLLNSFLSFLLKEKNEDTILFPFPFSI